MGNPEDAKFGMTKEQIINAYIRLKEEGVKTLGIHSFLASSQNNNEYYPLLAKQLFELIVEIKNLTGIELIYNDVLVKNGIKNIEIYTELGRYMLAPHGALITKAIHEKNTYKNYIGVDACATNLMRPAIYGAYHHISVLGKEKDEKTNIYDVVGCLCENNDKFAIDRTLPKIEKGDFLFIHDTGAHGFSMGYNYNGTLKSAELLLKSDKSVELIRRAENSKDYFATLI